jgi:Flp pilus assembly protein TadD
MIQNGVLVFEGRFQVARACALSHMQKAGNRLRTGELDEGLAEAQAAAAADPGFFGAQVTLGDALMRLGRREDARAAWQTALALARKLEPSVRDSRVRRIERRLGGR